MTLSTKYIVQFVGFTAHLSENDFIKRWTPIALTFKSAGIKTIDLYRVENSENINFISRNIWEEQIYFQNFPSGIAGSGSGGGISVTQLGGYWLQADYLESRDEMRLVFLTNSINISDKKIVSCLSVTDKIQFKQVLELKNSYHSELPINSFDITCNHLKQI